MSAAPGRIVRAGDYRALPWKNALGTSSVIASQPPGAGYDALDWQVATTRIESSCPFSSLDGFDRQFMLLEGEGVELHCRSTEGANDLRARVDQPLRPFAFSGGWQTHCTLLGAPVRVLNVMVRRSRATAEVSILEGGGPAVLEVVAGETVLLFAAVGTIRIGELSVLLEEGDSMIAEGARAERYSLSHPSARMVVARIRAVTGG